jgi:hypothetical protein
MFFPLASVSTPEPAAAYSYSCSWTALGYSQAVASGDIGVVAIMQDIDRNCRRWDSQDVFCIDQFTNARALTMTNTVGNIREIRNIIVGKAWLCDLDSDSGGGSSGGGDGGAPSLTSCKFKKTPTARVLGKNQFPGVLNPVLGNWRPTPDWVMVEWLRDGQVFLTEDDLGTYTLTPEDIGHRISVRVYAHLELCTEASLDKSVKVSQSKSTKPIKLKSKTITESMFSFEPNPSSSHFAFSLRFSGQAIPIESIVWNFPTPWQNWGNYYSSQKIQRVYLPFAQYTNRFGRSDYGCEYGTLMNVGLKVIAGGGVSGWTRKEFNFSGINLYCGTSMGTRTSDFGLWELNLDTWQGSFRPAGTF